MSESSRRDFLQSSTVATLLAATAAPAMVVAADAPRAEGGAFGFSSKPVPLPFDAKSLNGISEKLIQSHWANNYSGAVAALNTVRGRLAQALADANTPAYVYNGLKREQLFRTGSVVLHELYFANLGGSGKAHEDCRFLRHVRRLGE